ncbi:hypothetical protein LX83_006658 [Goodfellowiella coeruleoviolacea]|uniref:Uncharacterized protein n=1 Tax=Goodfellowiella coeruleoviolacea TaxID=334858 RepID=A0AAE3GK64_9PSEU|nr:hypothetical protein [Goodfellowiella coeruleoviolacea]
MTRRLPYQWRFCPDGQCHAFPTNQVEDVSRNTLQAAGACQAQPSVTPLPVVSPLPQP